MFYTQLIYVIKDQIKYITNAQTHTINDTHTINASSSSNVLYVWKFEEIYINYLEFVQGGFLKSALKKQKEANHTDL